MGAEEITNEPWWRGPLKYVIAIFLLFLVVMWIFPSWAVKLDPEPRGIPLFDDVVHEGIKAEERQKEISMDEYPSFVDSNDQDVKMVADLIATESCDGNKICHAKAIYYFVRDNFDYVSDPSRFEYVKGAKESLLSRGGDCDDAAILASSLLQAVGIETRFVFFPGHVYIQAYLPEALKKYKAKENDYVSLDATCKKCKFGELPYLDFSDSKAIFG